MDLNKIRSGWDKFLSLVLGGSQIDAGHYQKQLRKYQLEPMEVPSSLTEYQDGKFQTDVQTFCDKMNDDEGFDLFAFNALDSDIDSATLDAKTELHKEYDRRRRETQNLIVAMKSERNEIEYQIQRLENQLARQRDIIERYEADEKKPKKAKNKTRQGNSNDDDS